MTKYDPFARGPFPVGVRTFALTDAARDRRLLETEIWYPATDAHAGQDVAETTWDKYDLIPGFPPSEQEAVRDAQPRPGKLPFVALSHGFGGHRRQSTFLCTHLASHGYVVGAVDHTGNTIYDIMQFILQIQMGGEMPDPIALVSEFIAHRPSDVSFMIDEILHAGREGASNGGIALNPQSTIRNPQSEILQVDPERIGMAGHSFGGWTTLMVTARDHRIRAALPLAPAGGSSPLPVDPLREALDFNWGGRDVPTLFLTASRDSLLPLAGMHELLANTPAKQKKMIVLENADHMHFCDKVEQIHEMFRMMPPPGDFERIAQAVPPISELCPGEHAYQFSRALGLAHMDAHLKGDESAAQFLSGDVCSTFATRGVNVRVVA